ncbi:polysaccharide biosynthesis C-terminal domain-containing protein, partial [Neobacillus drentensis]
FIAIFGKFFITLLYGTEFSSAYIVTIIIFIGIISMTIYKILYPYYVSNGLQKFCYKVLLIGAIVNVILNFALIPLFGIEGAAISSVLSYSVCGYILLKRFLVTKNIRLLDLILITNSDKEYIMLRMRRKRKDS